MSIDNFKKILSSLEPEEIVEECLYRNYVHAIPKKNEYKEYINLILSDYKNAEHVAIMGSGNWCYSLNPDKNLRPFGDDSDIDIAIICSDSFNATWVEMRSYHRNNYYQLSHHQKTKIKRNGENVYSGFITPKWISNKASPTRFRYEVNSNKYSNKSVDYKPVNMMYFKNKIEVIDYYVRGFRLAKGALKNGL